MPTAVAGKSRVPPRPSARGLLFTIRQSYAPYRIRSEHEDNFTARLDVAQLGHAYLIRQAQPSLEAHRDSTWRCRLERGLIAFRPRREHLV